MPLAKSTETLNGQDIVFLVEVDTEPKEESPYQDTRATPLQTVKEATKDMMDDGMTLARNCAKKAVAGINALDDKFRPEEFELKIAIKLDSEMGAILAKASAGAQLEVTMKWKPREVSQLSAQAASQQNP